MYNQCKDYLKEKLRAAGVKTTIITSVKKLSSTSESHIGAVLFGDEVLTRNGSKRIWMDGSNRKKCRKIFDRNLTFSIYIGDHNFEAVESTYENFLELLDQGIMVDNNYIPIEPEAAEWIDEDDNILKAKVAVQLKVTFLGGVYKNTDFAPINEVNINDVGISREES